MNEKEAIGNIVSDCEEYGYPQPIPKLFPPLARKVYGEIMKREQKINELEKKVRRYAE